MPQNTGLFQGLFRQIQEWVQQEIQTRLTQAGIRGRTIDASYLRGVMGSGVTGGSVSNHDHSGDAGDGGTFDAANLTSGVATDNYVLTADGAGGAAWEAGGAGSVSAVVSAGALVSARILFT